MMKEKNEMKSVEPERIPPELVAEAKAGDQAAFTELYQRSSAMVYRTIRSMIQDEDQVWDVLQDSYLRAWRGLDKLETDEAFLPWLRRIAVNTAANALAKRVPLTFTELAGEEDDPEPEVPDLNPDTQPELALDRQESARLVRELLEELSPAQQAVMGMRYYEDMPVKDIAALLQISQSTVKNQLLRGRKRIEAGVRALEKRGVKLYGLSPLPFLLALLRRLEPGKAAEQKALAVVLAEAPAAGGTAAVTVTAMTAGQAFLHGLGTKLLAGALAVALLIGGGKLAYDALKKGTEPPIGIKETTAAETAARDEGETILPTGPTGSGEPALYSGVCGDDLTWRFDPDTGLLTIEGSGVMNSWHDAEPAPWSPFLDKITAVSFPEALFSIGERSFEGCSALRSVTIPENVSVIRPRAFSYCSSLGSVAIPEGVAAIEWMTFGGCSSLRSATIPESVTSIGAYAFSGCPDLTIYGAPGSEAERYANENGIPFQPLEEDPAPTDDDTTTPTEPSEPTEPLIEFPAGTDLGALHLASTAWEAESIEDDKWVGRALDFYADGSLYYREGRMFSEYALYLDGLWRTEEDGTLELILWYSPYDAWDRPDGYRVTAADVPADSWTARFTCEPRKGDCLDLTRQTERGFVNGEEDTWIELHPAWKSLPCRSFGTSGPGTMRSTRSCWRAVRTTGTCTATAAGQSSAASPKLALSTRRRWSIPSPSRSRRKSWPRPSRPGASPSRGRIMCTWPPRKRRHSTSAGSSAAMSTAAITAGS